MKETDDKLPYELKSIENLNQKMKDKTSGDKSPSKRTSKSILVSGKQKSKSNSKSDSTGSENELEKGEHLADLLMEIMQARITVYLNIYDLERGSFFRRRKKEKKPIHNYQENN